MKLKKFEIQLKNLKYNCKPYRKFKLRVKTFEIKFMPKIIINI